MCVNLERLAGSRGTGEGLEGLVRIFRNCKALRIAHELLNICINLEGVAGSRGTGEGVDGLVRVLRDWRGS